MISKSISESEINKYNIDFEIEIPSSLVNAHSIGFYSLSEIASCRKIIITAHEIKNVCL